MVEISHQLASVPDNWVDVRNSQPFVGQQFTAGHTGNKDLAEIELVGRKFGSSQLPAETALSLEFPVPFPVLWTYYGTNVYAGGKGRFYPGNEGVISLYAEYQTSCNLSAGQVVSWEFPTRKSDAGSGTVNFDVVVTNVGGSQVLTFPVFIGAGITSNKHTFRVLATESWTTYKVEFNNFTWSNLTGWLEVSGETPGVPVNDMEIITSLSTWDAAESVSLTATMYDDTNESLNVICANHSLRFFPTDIGEDMTGKEVMISPDTEVYAMVAGREYRTTTGINNLAVLEDQLSELTVPVLPDGADPQVQSSLILPENLIPGAPCSTTCTFELNPDRDSSVFAGEVRREGVILEGEADKIGVEAGEDYTFRARIRIPSTGTATTYTISVNSENDDSVIASRSQALVDQVPDYFFEEELAFTMPADTSTVYFVIDVTVAVPFLYTDGMMLTKDSDGTPVKYHYSTRVGAPASISMKTAASEADPMYSWETGAWAEIDVNSFVTTVWVGDEVSALPTGPVNPISNLLATVSWPTELCDQPPVMAAVIAALQTAGDTLIDNLRPIVQVNKPTKPLLSDWVSAYRKSGGEGDIPSNGSFRWADSNETSPREYTSEFVILDLDTGETQPIAENGTDLLGSTTRTPFNFVNTAKDVTNPPSPTIISYTDGWQVYVDMLRGGQMEARILYTAEGLKLIPLYLDGIEEASPSFIVSLTSIEAPSNVAASVGHQEVDIGEVSAGELDMYWGLSTSGWIPNVFEFSALSAILDPEDMPLPMSQIEVYHV